MLHKIIQFFRQCTDIPVAGVGSGNYIYFWKSKGLSDGNITAPSTSDYNLNPQSRYLGNKAIVECKGV